VPVTGASPEVSSNIPGVTGTRGDVGDLLKVGADAGLAYRVP